MKTYKIITRPDLYYVRPGLPSLLTKELLLEELAGVVVRELSEDERGHQTIDVRFRRESDPEALDEIIALLQQLGFVILKATVTEWANELVERAVLGLLGGGAIGAATENGTAALIASAAGALIGGLTGAEAQKLKAEYEARRDHTGNWTFRELPRQPPAPGAQPGFSPA
jgi:hypothetical protein